MQTALIARSFLPYALRFLWRHPNKLGRLRRLWSEYVGRFHKVAGLTDSNVEDAVAVFHELECREPLFREVGGMQVMGMHPLIYYALVRLIRPDCVVETGVMAGMSSRFILLAMQKNDHGVLHSIDLPNQDVELEPGGARQRDVMSGGRPTGFLVPEQLRARWRLHLGDARELLPGLLTELKLVDVFIHDSLHSYDHMMFEFKTAWPHIRPGGVMFSDDINYNQAFAEFACEVAEPPVIFNERVGALRTPAHEKGDLP